MKAFSCFSQPLSIEHWSVQYRILVYYEISNGSEIPVYRISVYHEILNCSEISVNRILVYYEKSNGSEIPILLAIYRILFYYEIPNGSEIPVYRILKCQMDLQYQFIAYWFIMKY